MTVTSLENMTDTDPLESLIFVADFYHSVYVFKIFAPGYELLSGFHHAFAAAFEDKSFIMFPDSTRRGDAEAGNNNQIQIAHKPFS